MLVWGDMATILVADDSPEMTTFISRLLSADGYRCVTVPDGRAAVEACARERIDVVLLDVNMPGCDGLEACRILKNAPDTALIPVLVMTGTCDAASHLAALEAGADDFLPKPLGLSELRARVRSAVRVKRCVDELDNAAATIVMLGAAIEARDASTKGHCERLAGYATTLGRRVGLDPHDLRALEQGGYLHDLGKIGIPDAVLFKPSPLTREEFELIKTHPVVGDRICAPLRTLSRARPIIRSHHELLDGSGYPDGLRGREVPLLAQVTGICDVYDAMVSDRPYRPAVGRDEALALLRADARAGKRDAALVEEFTTMVLAAEMGGDAAVPWFLPVSSPARSIAPVLRAPDASAARGSAAWAAPRLAVRACP